MTSAEAGCSTREVKLASLPPYDRHEGILQSPFPVQLVQDMHVIPRCWDTNDLRREEGPAIPPSQVKQTALNQGKTTQLKGRPFPRYAVDG